MSWAPVAKDPRRKNPQYLRRHKAARIRELLIQRKREARDEAGLGRYLDRNVRRAEAAFKGCKVS